MKEFPEWTRIATRLGGVVNETEAKLAERREWLREYLRGGQASTAVAAGQGLAGALLQAAHRVRAQRMLLAVRQ